MFFTSQSSPWSYKAVQESWQEWCRQKKQEYTQKEMHVHPVTRFKWFEEHQSGSNPWVLPEEKWVEFLGEWGFTDRDQKFLWQSQTEISPEIAQEETEGWQAMQRWLQSIFESEFSQEVRWEALNASWGLQHLMINKLWLEDAHEKTSRWEALKRTNVARHFDLEGLTGTEYIRWEQVRPGQIMPFWMLSSLVDVDVETRRSWWEGIVKSRDPARLRRLETLQTWCQAMAPVFEGQLKFLIQISPWKFFDDSLHQQSFFIFQCLNTLRQGEIGTAFSHQAFEQGWKEFHEKLVGFGLEQAEHRLGRQWLNWLPQTRVSFQEAFWKDERWWRALDLEIDRFERHRQKILESPVFKPGDCVWLEEYTDAEEGMRINHLNEWQREQQRARRNKGPTLCIDFSREHSREAIKRGLWFKNLAYLELYTTEANPVATLEAWGRQGLPILCAIEALLKAYARHSVHVHDSSASPITLASLFPAQIEARWWAEIEDVLKDWKREEILAQLPQSIEDVQWLFRKSTPSDRWIQLHDQFELWSNPIIEASGASGQEERLDRPQPRLEKELNLLWQWAQTEKPLISSRESLKRMRSVLHQAFDLHPEIAAITLQSFPDLVAFMFEPAFQKVATLSEPNQHPDTVTPLTPEKKEVELWFQHREGADSKRRGGGL